MVKIHKATWLLRYWIRHQMTVIPERRKTQEANSTVPACCLESLQATTQREKTWAKHGSFPELGGQAWQTGVFGEDYWREENSASTEPWRPAVGAPEALAQNLSAPVCEETTHPRTGKAHLKDQLEQSLRLTQVKQCLIPPLSERLHNLWVWGRVTKRVLPQ